MPARMATDQKNLPRTTLCWYLEYQNSFGDYNWNICLQCTAQIPSFAKLIYLLSGDRALVTLITLGLFSLHCGRHVKIQSTVTEHYGSSSEPSYCGLTLHKYSWVFMVSMWSSTIIPTWKIQVGKLPRKSTFVHIWAHFIYGWHFPPA